MALKTNDEILESIVNLCFKQSNKEGVSDVLKLGEQQANRLAASLINRGLCHSDSLFVLRLARDSWTIYSHANTSNRDYYRPKITENEWSVTLLESNPLRSYFRSSLLQVMHFILHYKAHSHLVNTDLLLCFINELRDSFDAICDEDRESHKNSLKELTQTTIDASNLIKWTLIEAAKHCICQKFALELPANQYLSLLQKEITKPFGLADKITRHFLVNYWQNIDKLLLDRVSESSICKQTFSAPPNVEEFFQINRSNFLSWLNKNRQAMARLSLIVDDPAECWRNINHKLCLDMEAKFLGSTSTTKDTSFTQTLMSLNAKNWYSNLSLLAISAKQLEDKSVLYGIRSLTGIICDYQPISAILSNLDGNYSETYNRFLEMDDADEQTLVEFLNSCIELNRLEEHSDKIHRLKSHKLKQLYIQYLESRIEKNNSSSRFKEVEQWLGTWSDLNDQSDISEAQPLQTYIDLVVPSILNFVSKAPLGGRPELIERVESLISQDFMVQCLFPPNYINKNYKIYHVLLNSLKHNKLIDGSIIGAYSNDYQWNHKLYRHLCDFNLIDEFRNQRELIDLIQYKAAKFNWKSDNIAQALNIAKNLIDQGKSKKIQLLSSLLLVKAESPSGHPKFDALCKLASEIKITNLEISVKSDLLSKILRCVLRFPVTEKVDETHLLNIIEERTQQVSAKDLQHHSYVEQWNNLLDSSSLSSRIKTLSVLSNRLNEQLQTSTDDDKLLNTVFHLEIRLIRLICQSNLDKDKSAAIECAMRILEHIKSKPSRLSQDNLVSFRACDFISDTKSVWINLKTNLLSLISYKTDLVIDWRNTLIDLVKTIVRERPELFVYSTIVNRLDLQSKLVYFNDETALGLQESSEILLHNEVNDIQEPNRKREDYRRTLAFWNEIFKLISECDNEGTNWSNLVSETEKFIKEIRKISYLPAEYLKSLTMRMPRKFHNFLDHFAKFADPKLGMISSRHRLEECEIRLQTICEHNIRSIKILLAHCDRSREASKTIYDSWFSTEFSKHLKELEYRLKLLVNKKPMILKDLERLTKSITELLAHCRVEIAAFQNSLKQKLYMEMISPMLSRLVDSTILMPDYCDDLSKKNKSLVTIHKTSQLIHMIHSKTHPKTLHFIGSDGVSRLFLLKAHEDLRLDQLIMELFGSINSLFVGKKETRDKFKLRRYSVTPVSNRSGLIQWIEAPSLSSLFRSWLGSPNGKKSMEELYKETCDILCHESNSAKTTSIHTNCQPPQSVLTIDPFHQLLWAKAKSIKHPLAAIRPSPNNIIKYRAELDSKFFEDIVKQLSARIPKELISHRLWYSSSNSHQYWLKTQEFIQSCATISIVGYIIGLGDRHTDNILLDSCTGEVIHIDYNVCFEMGKTLSIPEQVPFRLTQNIIHAFGFAGLEGGFAHCCRQVLDVMKSSKSTILNHLDPINLSFMICKPSIDEFNGAQAAASGVGLSRTVSDVAGSKWSSIRHEHSTRMPLELDMCSQESVEETKSIGCDVTDLLILNNTSKKVHVQRPSCVADQLIDVKPTKYHWPLAQSHDLQHNIKTPTKISARNATNIHERIRDKLYGADEFIRHHRYMQNNEQIGRLLSVPSKRQRNESSSKKQVDDLILLNDAQSTEDQVNSLIIEAASIKNKAAMFEGWLPWF